MPWRLKHVGEDPSMLLNRKPNPRLHLDAALLKPTILPSLVSERSPPWHPGPYQPINPPMAHTPFWPPPLRLTGSPMGPSLIFSPSTSSSWSKSPACACTSTLPSTNPTPQPRWSSGPGGAAATVSCSSGSGLERSREVGKRFHWMGVASVGRRRSGAWCYR